MTRTVVARTIDAPVETVFRTIGDIREFSQALPHIEKVEFLTEAHVGLGTRFRETRRMGSSLHVNELEVTEYVENERIRYVTDNNGTVWDTIFTTQSSDAGTALTLTMDARAYKLMSRIMNPLFKGMIRKAIEKDMDLVKSHCEQS